MTQFTIADETHSAQGLAHPDLAEPKSRDFEALAQRDTGVVSGCAVTAKSPADMTLAVASGVVRIAGVDHAVAAGDVTLTANASGLPRYDDVVVNTSGVKSVIAGTAAAEATLDDPAIDFTSFCWLQKVFVASGATAISATEFVSKAIPQNPNAHHDKLHAASHATGGADAMAPSDIGAPTLGSTPSTQAFGDAAAGGSATTASKNDHKHGMPAAPGERAAASTTPAAIGTAAVGTGTTDARSDHVHATGAGTPSTQASGDAAATGTGPAAAMTDHKHGFPDLMVPFVFSKQGAVAVTAEGDTPPPHRIYNDTGRTLTIVAIRATATAGPAGATMIIDANVDGTTVMTGTKVVIADGGNTIKQTTFSTTTIADGHYFSVNVDQVGSTTAGSNLTVVIWCKG